MKLDPGLRRWLLAEPNDVIDADGEMAKARRAHVALIERSTPEELLAWRRRVLAAMGAELPDPTPRTAAGRELSETAKDMLKLAEHGDRQPYLHVKGK